MKNIKLYMLLLVTILVAACSDDLETEGVNPTPSNVTVQFKDATFTTKENKGVVLVPLKIEGKLSGSVRLKVSVSPAETNPAVAEQNYVLTSTDYIIGSDAVNAEGTMVETVGIEINTIDDIDINENRVFVMKIESVEGATLGANVTSNVVLKDNDSNFYEKLEGAWKMSVIKPKDGSKSTFDVKVIGASEGEADYESMYTVTGFNGYDWTSMRMSYSYNKTTKVGKVAIQYGEQFADGVNFGLPKDPCSVTLCGLLGDKLVTSGELTGTWNDTFSEITFDPSGALCGAIFGSDNAFTGYTWFTYSTAVMSR